MRLALSQISLCGAALLASPACTRLVAAQEYEVEGVIDERVFQEPNTVWTETRADFTVWVRGQAWLIVEGVNLNFSHMDWVKPLLFPQ